MKRISRLLPDIAGVYGLIAFLAMTGFAGPRALLDGDTLWHIKAGEIMLDQGQILTTDIFSHTANGKPWLAHEWLAEIIMAALHNWAGLAGVVIFYFLLAAATYWLLFKLAEDYGGPWLAVTCVTIATVLSMTHLLARPHIFSWFLGVLTLYILMRGKRSLYILPVLTAIWVNLHGGFVLGLALQGLFLGGKLLEQGGRLLSPAEWKTLLREHRDPIVVLLLSILAVGLNPFGYKLLLFPFQVTAGSFSTSIAEWVSPNLQAFWHFRLLILFIVFLLFFHGPRISWTNRLLVLFFLNQAMLHSRHVSIAGLFLTPFLLEALAPWFEGISDWLGARRKVNRNKVDLQLSRASGPILTALVTAVLLATLGANGNFQKKFTQGFFPLPEKFSHTAIDFLKAHQPGGKMFNGYDLGDYLIYALGPEYPVFIDGRADMYGEKIFDDYLKIGEVSDDTDRLLQEYGVDWVIFSSSKPLTLYLQAKTNWQEEYRDDQVSILVRKTL